MYQAQQWDILSGPGVTALGVAATGALESDRPDRLIDDPYAAAFVAAVPSPIPRPLRWPEDGTVDSELTAYLVHASNYLGVRSRFFDDFLLDTARAGCAQFVILAAGLDTRAFRLCWPAGTRLYELDQPAVLAFKDQVLAEQGARVRCDRQPIGIDLRDDWPAALLAAGFDPAVPTGWLAEVLLPYLPPEAEWHLFATIDKLSAPGSRLAVEHPTDLPNLVRDHEVEAIRRAGVDMAELLHSDPRPSPEPWLIDRGWSVRDEPADQVALRYRRDLTRPVLDNLPDSARWAATGQALLSAHRAD